MTQGRNAVFLSYASQDAEAAKRICEALRAAGVEVWFDRSELRGGDAWDQKIRRQIKECALFVPVVSADTQARTEGYFRLEWRLADQRTHLMAKGRPFLLPVVIDDTSDAEAHVPDSFTDVQWTRLVQGELPAAFVSRVAGLLGENQTRPAGNPVSPVSAPLPPKAVAQRRRVVPMAIVVGVTLAAIAGWMIWQRNPLGSGGTAAPVPPVVTFPLPAAPALPANEKSVAVLPFENLSDEPGSAYFADGIHDEVLTAVGKVSGLKVIGRTSVLRYADVKQRNLREISSSLGVGTVVEGTVRRLANRVRLTVRLVNTQTEQQLWGDSFDGELTDAFAIQSSIAQQIAATLRTTLTAGERADLARQPTQNSEAYRLYLHATALLRSLGVPSRAPRAKLDEIVALCEQAAAADPTFVRPHVQLAALHGYLYWFGDFDPTAERAQKAEHAAERVRALAPGSAEARLTTGDILYRCRNDWPAALVEFRAAAQSLPNDPDSRAGMGNCLRRMGRWQEAIASYQQVLVIDPHNLTVGQTLLETWISMRRYPEMLAASNDLLMRLPDSAALLSFRAQAHFALDGNLKAYMTTLGDLAPRLKGYSRLWPYQAYLRAGNVAAAEALLAESGPAFTGPGGVVASPVAHNRAFIEFLRGNLAGAKAFAAIAEKQLAAHPATPRQRAILAAELALAHALGGDAGGSRASATRSAELMRSTPDAMVETEVRALRATAMLVLGDTKAALAEVRLLTRDAFPSHLTVMDLRQDPLWSRLAAEPEFEEILANAKPL